MEINQDWEIRLIEECRRVSKNGYGKVNVIMSECTRGQGERVKVVIEAGCSYIFFTIKDIYKSGL